MLTDRSTVRDRALHRPQAEGRGQVEGGPHGQGARGLPGLGDPPLHEQALGEQGGVEPGREAGVGSSSAKYAVSKGAFLFSKPRQ